eukprot:3382281-Alexandrium_andersonii.AAC.1
MPPSWQSGAPRERAADHRIITEEDPIEEISSDESNATPRNLDFTGGNHLQPGHTPAQPRWRASRRQTDEGEQWRDQLRAITEFRKTIPACLASFVNPMVEQAEATCKRRVIASKPLASSITHVQRMIDRDWRKCQQLDQEIESLEDE